MTCSAGFSNFGICGGGCYQLLNGGSWTGNWENAKSGCEGLSSSAHLAGKFRFKAYFSRFDLTEITADEIPEKW